jgi:16S rRNA processing protein RimM
MAGEKRVLLGHIRAAHGIKGDVTIQSYANDPVAIADYGPLTNETGQRVFEIVSVRETGKGLIARLRGVDDRTAAEALRNTALYVPRSRLPPAHDGDYYHVDLVGLAAHTLEGAPFGTVVSVQNFGAGDLLEVLRTGTKRTELIPFTDACVPTVDIAAGRLTILPPDMIEADPNEPRDA